MRINIFFNKNERSLVGQLERRGNYWVFQYNKKWIVKDIPFGLDLVHREGEQIFKDLPKSFLERIPKKENPNYSIWCKKVGIEESESDLMILLVTLGHKGLDHFTLEPEGYSPGFWG